MLTISLLAIQDVDLLHQIVVSVLGQLQISFTLETQILDLGYVMLILLLDDLDFILSII